MTGLIRDLVRTYPHVQVDVKTSCRDIWRNNPYLTPIPETEPVKQLTLCYQSGIKRQNRATIHFLGEFHYNFEKQTGLRVPITEPRPDLHLSPDELVTPLVSGRYWVVVAGGKSDATVKVWSYRYWQETVDLLRSYGIQVVQLGALDKGHQHATLTGTLNLVGKTNLRDMIRIIGHSEGVISGVTAAMHMAAGLQKPCVTIGGGREAWWWEAYVRENRGLGCPEKLLVPHRYLHTIGLLSCCKDHGCWKNKVTEENGDPLICHMPVITPGQAIPRCMEMITPSHVVEAVMSYYEDRTLPPIKPLVDVRLPQIQTISTNMQLASKPFALFDEPAEPVSVQVLPSPIVPAVVAPLEGQKHPPAVVQGTNELYDHPTIGGKYTAFVLLYGPAKFAQMHRRCLDSLISTVPPERLDLRVGSNELCEESVRYVEGLVDKGVVTKHYRHRSNDKKYPVMREMFWDDSCPITTKWLLWFDDDSIADRDRMWLHKLTQVIIEGYGAGKHLYGDHRIWQLKPGQASFYRERPWFRNRPFRDAKGNASPNGNKVHFVAGGFWAMSVEAMRTCDVPDLRLNHNGGDYTIGEQLWQNGFGLRKWNSNKQFIHTSSVARRGYSEAHVGTQPTVKQA